MAGTQNLRKPIIPLFGGDHAPVPVWTREAPDHPVRHPSRPHRKYRPRGQVPAEWVTMWGFDDLARLDRKADELSAQMQLMQHSQQSPRDFADSGPGAGTLQLRKRLSAMVWAPVFGVSVSLAGYAVFQIALQATPPDVGASQALAVAQVVSQPPANAGQNLVQPVLARQGPAMGGSPQTAARPNFSTGPAIAGNARNAPPLPSPQTRVVDAVACADCTARAPKPQGIIDTLRFAAMNDAALAEMFLPAQMQSPDFAQAARPAQLSHASARPVIAGSARTAPRLALPQTQAGEGFSCSTCYAPPPDFENIFIAVFATDTGASALIDGLSTLGAKDVRIRTTQIAAATNQVRFYRAEDAPYARYLAGRYDARIVDLTWFAPSSDIATLDLLLATAAGSNALSN